jgi:hypothetical protein
MAGSTSTVLPKQVMGNYKTWAVLNLSTNSDGVTGGDVLDCSGLTLSGISLSSLAAPGVVYSFKVGLDSTSLKPLQTSSGALLTVGSTLLSNSSAIIGFDPSPFCGLRYIQPMTMSTNAAQANVTGAQMTMFLSAFGYVP